MEFNFLQNPNDIPTCIKDYCLLQKLGRGAFGDVFKAIPLKGKLKSENIALKIINKAKLTSQTHRRRIVNEIYIHSSLERHKNILDFYTSFEDDQNIYIVTQLCSQGSLYSFIQTQSFLPLKENFVKKIMKEIVSGLIFLHSHKIIHRDLKLSNILLDENSIAKIADFGLSTILQNFSDEEPMTLCGTPNYISPEIITHGPCGLASDIWSLGCIFFCLLDNSPPFQSENISGTLMQITNGNLRQLPSYVSNEAKNLVNKMLQKNPSNRIKTHEILNHPFFNSTLNLKEIIKLNPEFKSEHKSTFSSNFEKLEAITDISKLIRHEPNLATLKNNKDLEKSKENDKKEFTCKKFSSILDTSIIASPEKKVLQRIENILNENKKNSIYKKIKKKDMHFSINPLLKHNLSSNLDDLNNNIGYIRGKSFTIHCDENDIRTCRDYKNSNLLNTMKNNLNNIIEDQNIDIFKNQRKKTHIYDNFYKKCFDSESEYIETQTISYIMDTQKSTNKFDKIHNESPSKLYIFSNNYDKQKTRMKYNTKDFKNLKNLLRKGTLTKSDLDKKHQGSYMDNKFSSLITPISDFAKKYHFNTKGLNVIKQKTKHADIEITKKGYLRLSFHNMSWECLINSDGIKIKIIQSDRLPQMYHLDDLPAKYLRAYRYASKFISILKSKIPKIILDTPYAKCRLYLNSVFEIRYINSQTMIIQLDSKKQIVKMFTQNSTENKDKLLYEGDIESAYKDFPEIIIDTINRYKRCINLGKESEDDIADNYAKFINGKGWWWINKKIGIMMFLDGSQLQVYFKSDDNYLTTRSISRIKFINNNIHEVYELNDNKVIPETVKKKLFILKDYGLL
ncbi:hypothetical protein PNEG_01384 [Pneumocystis murina B123]|uniref:Uncharacterized protein n=1 Tax=Pneumocystis murina (strain B123) TaxID=1069680 RepID=M7P8A0_PNEMU|nr:hypothetical protein PNEG_01384 [Pneumocystis murina B123]EMR10105.1 hypothetical protein PNEG_01384 [Pneumocystis murina B123]